MKIKFASKKTWIWFLLLIAGTAAGIIYSAQLTPYLLPMIMESFANILGNGQEAFVPSVNLAVTIFLKNLLVAVICFLTARITFGVIPGAILLFNGLVIGLLGKIFIQEGLPLFTFVALLLPHGIFELYAIFLACAIGIKGLNKTGWQAMLIPCFILSAAAGIEVYITPLLAR
jgi:uncharacterized membrane protein SpoIIM required for sporulation